MRSSLIKGVIFDIQKFAIHDGPGIRTTVFFKGCPLDCWWCHNPESQSGTIEMMFHKNRCIGCGACVDICPQKVIVPRDGGMPLAEDGCSLCGACVEVCYAEAREWVGREMSVEQVMDEVTRDIAFYDTSGGGVTFSGGEPLAQVDFLLALLKACKEWEIETALDTCGFAPWEHLEQVLDHIDLFLYDLKLMDDRRHQKFTGVSNRLILENLKALSSRGARIVLRVPVIPGVNDDDGNIRQLGAFVADLPSLERLELLPYHHVAMSKYERLQRVYRMADTCSPIKEDMVAIARVLESFGLKVKIGG